MKRGTRLGYGLLLLLFMLFLLGNMILFPIQAAGLLAIGWIVYLVQILPKVQLQWEAIFSGILYAGLLVLLSHAFLRWLWESWHRLPAPLPQRVSVQPQAVWPPELLPDSRGDPHEGESMRRLLPWRFRQTLRLHSSLLLVFALAMSAAGILHQLGWLLTTDSPLLDVQFMSPRSKSLERRMKQRCLAAGQLLRSRLEERSSLPPDWLWLAPRLNPEDLEEFIVVVLPDLTQPSQLLIFPRALSDRVQWGGLLCLQESPERLPYRSLAELFPPALN